MNAEGGFDFGTAPPCVRSSRRGTAASPIDAGGMSAEQAGDDRPAAFVFE